MNPIFLTREKAISSVQKHMLCTQKVPRFQVVGLGMSVPVRVGSTCPDKPVNSFNITKRLYGMVVRLLN